MKLPESYRSKFKQPLGKLILNNELTKNKILSEISYSKLVITVGDATTQLLQDYGIMPDIQIIDGLEKRFRKTIAPNDNIKTKLHCKNPPGQITDQAISTIKNALNASKPVRILVEGEEDLLVIPVCLEAPLGTIIMYGQPNEGLVVISLSTEIKNKAKELFRLME